jgi:hypothetical protein
MAATMTTVREKYGACQVKPTTTSFAIYSQGTVYMLDASGNQAISQQMTSGTLAGGSDQNAGSRFMMVSVNGTPQGDRLTGVTTVERQRGGRGGR